MGKVASASRTEAMPMAILVEPAVIHQSTIVELAGTEEG